MIAAFVAELRRRDPLLFRAAVANHMLLVLMLLARAGRPARWVVLAGLGYGALALALFVQALAGKPLIGL